MNAGGRPSRIAVLSIACTVFVAGILLIPARHQGASDRWYSIAESDAKRYIDMAHGDPIAYPWGGRWLLPFLSSLFRRFEIEALQTLNYACLLAAIAAITYLALHSARTPAVGAAWLFAGTGAALPMLFQNPFLVDSAGLLVFALIGVANRRQAYTWVTAFVVVGVTIKEVVIGFLLLLALRKRWAELGVAVVASVALLYYGKVRSQPGSAVLPDLSAGLVVKFVFGLGAAWLLVALAVAYLMRSRSLPRLDAEYFSLTAGLSLAALPLATDTSRLLVFALPAVIPLCALVLSASPLARLGVGGALAVPAALSVIPSRLTLDHLRPTPFNQLETWYTANWELIAGFALSAIVGAIIASWPTLRQVGRRGQPVAWRSPLSERS